MSTEYRGIEKLNLIFSKEDYEIAHKCIAFALIRSLYEKGKIDKEIMKKSEQMFKSCGDC